ncbi:unnamed protein product [Hyaloperonospora brassicae]|uniref:CCHC-type domain-containing protein n=1 Tax=Hyaloperonospora brassicae TaxID=162125 RepID=A0AAV0T998_HYABA|nr:unnamed protein product [Hyaloperonospora brassicae]
MVLRIGAARARRLWRPVPARCALALLREHVAVSLVHVQQRQSSTGRAGSTFNELLSDSRKRHTTDPLIEKEEDVEATSDSSPLARLLLHSKHFQLEMEKVSYDDGEEEEEEVVDSNGRDGAGDGSEGYRESSSTRRRSSDTWERRLVRRQRYGNAELGRSAVDHIVHKDTDEIDYDAGLENVWDELERKQRRFDQTLRRDHDRDHVCTNCGERGHRARNCLVPPICSNCGNFGHRAHQCRYGPTPDTIDEFLAQGDEIHERKKKDRKVRKKAIEAVNNPSMPRPQEVPMSHFYTRNEDIRKELDAELDAYADVLETQARKRRARKAEKDAATTSVSEK